MDFCTISFNENRIFRMFLSFNYFGKYNLGGKRFLLTHTTLMFIIFTPPFTGAFL